jgi:hypothetical protein
MALRFLSDEPLRVTAELRGAPLASPLRRFLALGLDLVLIAFPNLLALTAVAWLTLRVQDPAAFRALPVVYGATAKRPAAPEALAAIAPLLVSIEAEGLPHEVEEAVKAHDLGRAATLLRPYRFEFLVSVGEHENNGPVGPHSIRVRVADIIPPGLRVVASLGVLALYFSLFTAGRRGQTLGKRLLGIRVARLDGHRLSLLESLERFIGYLHIPGSLGLSILDLWRDPNRRMAHDRVAHTAVIRSRLKTRRAPATPPAPPSQPAHGSSGEGPAGSQQAN